MTCVRKRSLRTRLRDGGLYTLRWCWAQSWNAPSRRDLRWERAMQPTHEPGMHRWTGGSPCTCVALHYDVQILTMTRYIHRLFNVNTYLVLLVQTDISADFCKIFWTFCMANNIRSMCSNDLFQAWSVRAAKSQICQSGPAHQPMDIKTLTTMGLVTLATTCVARSLLVT